MIVTGGADMFARFIPGALFLLIALTCPGLAEEKLDPKAAATPPTSDSDAVARYCANIKPAVAEFRAARQLKRLAELDAEIQNKVKNLTERETQVREWVSQRQALLQKATESMVAIFGKMDNEAAASRLALLEDETAAAVLIKLPTKSAGAILNEMEPSRAAKLVTILSASATNGKKP